MGKTVECPACGAVCLPQTLPKHQGKLICLALATQRTLKVRGLELVANPQDRALLRSVGITIESHYTSHIRGNERQPPRVTPEFWAPAWAVKIVGSSRSDLKAKSYLLHVLAHSEDREAILMEVALLNRRRSK